MAFTTDPSHAISMEVDRIILAVCPDGVNLEIDVDIRGAFDIGVIRGTGSCLHENIVHL